MMRPHLLLLLGFFLPMASAFQPLVQTTKTASVAATTTTTNSRYQSASSLNMVVDPQQAWTAYNDALVTNPLLVKSVTAGVILGAADLAGQAVQDAQNGDSTDIDIARTVRFAFFGLVLQAPWNHFYYMALDGAIPPTADPWTSTTAVKTVIDQFLQAPIFTVLIFAFLGFLEGKNVEAIKKQLDDDYADTMVANCKKNRWHYKYFCYAIMFCHRIRLDRRPNFYLILTPCFSFCILLLYRNSNTFNLLRAFFSCGCFFSFITTIREIMGTSYGDQSCICSTHSSRSVFELRLFLLVNLSLAQTQQG